MDNKLVLEVENTELNNNNDMFNHGDNAKLSFKFGFLGIGMGGTSIAAACADVLTNVKNNRYPYVSLLINSNFQDLEKVVTENPNSKKLLIGAGKGAGRDIGIGESLYKEHSELIIKEITNQFADVDFVWLVVGLGGGTGTGAAIQAIGSLMKNGFSKKFGLILTLPRTQEGATVINNALIRLNQISGAMKGLGPIILVDNKKLFNEFKEKHSNSTVAEYLSFSNKYVADALHDLNTVTASYIPTGENHFDGSEFGKILITPGLIHFARFSTKPSQIDVSQQLSYVGKLKELIENGVLSDGYDLTQAKRVALSVLALEGNSKRLFTQDFTEQLEDFVTELAPIAKEKPVATYTHRDKSKNNVYFYSVFAGLDFPEERSNELLAENQRLIELEKSLKKEEKNLFAGLTIQSETSLEPVSFDDLFADAGQESNETEVSSEELALKKLGFL